MDIQIKEKPVGDARQTPPRLRPKVNIVERQDGFEIHLALPGVREDSLSVVRTPDLLTIEGPTDDPEQNERRQIRRERRGGTYFRQFLLSGIVNQAQIGARLENDLLTLTLPKAEQTQTRRIAFEAVV